LVPSSVRNDVKLIILEACKVTAIAEIVLFSTGSYPDTPPVFRKGVLTSRNL
jgi:hypothetical protein